MADSWEDDDFEPVTLVTANTTVAAAPVAVAVSVPDAGEESDGGNWDDDDFEAPVILSKPAAVQGEEEEDLVYAELNKVEKSIGAPKKTAEQLRKQAAEEEEILAKARNGGKEETAEQKRLRERKQQEESDLAQAADAFAGFTVDSSALEKEKKKSTPQAFEQLTKGIGSVLLKTKQDHVNFGVNTQLKLCASETDHIVAFYVAVFEVLKSSSYTLQILTPIMDEIKKAYEAKVKDEKRRNFVPVRKIVKTEKAAVLAACDDGDFFGDDDDGFGDDMGFGGSSAAKGEATSAEEEEARVSEELRQQHAQFGNAIVLKFARSTAQNVSAFFQAFSAILKEAEWDSLQLGDVMGALQTIYAAREKVEAKQPKVKTAKDLRKEKEDKEKRMKEIFGDSAFDDSYGDYTAMEDKYNCGREDTW